MAELRLDVEPMNGFFTKHHLSAPAGEAPFAVPVVLHHFSAVDPFDQAHDHPWPFTSRVLRGWYLEEVWRPHRWKGWQATRVRREVGDGPFRVEAAHIHRIIELSDGGCWTLVEPGPAERETRFWRFYDVASDQRVAWSRAWHSGAWRREGV